MKASEDEEVEEVEDNKDDDDEHWDCIRYISVGMFVLFVTKAFYRNEDTATALSEIERFIFAVRNLPSSHDCYISI